MWLDLWNEVLYNVTQLVFDLHNVVADICYHCTDSTINFVLKTTFIYLVTYYHCMPIITTMTAWLSSHLTLLTWPLRSVTVAWWTTLQDHVIICSYLPGSCSLLLGPTSCFHWFTASVFARTSANTGPLYRVVTINREHTQHIPAHISDQAREEHLTIVFCIKVASLFWGHVKAAWL